MKENVVEETANPEKPAESKKPDRKLGDEWADWDGSRENEYDEPKGRFVLFTLIVWAVAVVGLYVMGYMAGPRLDQWPQALSFIARAFFIALLGGGLIVYALVLLEIVTEKITFIPYKWSERMLLWLLPKAVQVGKWFGFDRDRVSNSFVKANNALSRSCRRKLQKHKLLVLLPRCLNKETRQGIKDLSQGYSLGMYTVGGGEEARKAVRKEHPNFIIAVACERDLISGIKDVALHIPVIGICNKRPDGPCKNTHIDLDEYRRAIRLFDMESAAQKDTEDQTPEKTQQEMTQ